jgi:hypothetical protein
MIQVKEFFYAYEEDINKWLKENQEIEVIDIKYSVAIIEGERASGALIIYKINEYKKSDYDEMLSMGSEFKKTLDITDEEIYGYLKK